MGLFDGSKDVATLRGEVEQLKTEMRLLRLEWEETFDKVTAAVARLRKRDRDEEKRSSTPTEDEAPTGTAPKADLYARAAALLRGNGNGVRR